MKKLYLRLALRYDRKNLMPLSGCEAKRKFYKSFSGAEEASLEYLWLAFQRWRKDKLERDFDQFKSYLSKRKIAAETEVNEWPNPFPPGKKGEAYSCDFRLPSCILKFELKGLKELGLTLEHPDSMDPLRCVVSGMPSRAGEFVITLNYIWAGFTRQHKVLKREFNIRINPDPRELWKNLPTPKDIEYYKPEYDGARIEAGEMRLLAASVRGRSHAHAALARDDDFAVKYDAASGWIFLCVADGAGSAKFSRRGSQIACEVAEKVCFEKLAEMRRLEKIFLHAGENGLETSENIEAKKLAYQILPQAAFAANKALQAEARAREYQLKDFSTTLLMTLVKKYPSGWAVISFQIGDGAMGLLSNEGGNISARLLAVPDEGEYGGQTRFITMSEVFEPQDLMRRIKIEIVKDLEAVILMTDGVSDAKFSTLANLENPRYWRDLWWDLVKTCDSPEPVEKLLKWLEFWSQGNHDDRTVAILAHPANPEA